MSDDEFDEPPAKKKTRKRRGTSFDKKKKGTNKAEYTYVKLPPASRKRQAGRNRISKKYTADFDADWLCCDFVTVSQTYQRRHISLFYLDILQAPPPEEWRGAGGSVSQIVGTLRLNKNQRKKVLRVITKTHHSLTVGKDFDATRAYRAGTAFIKDGRATARRGLL